MSNSIENVIVNGLEIEIADGSEVRFEGELLGVIGREQRFEQWFWRAFDRETGVPYKRFFSARHEAIRLLLIHADLMDGLGF